MNTIQAKRRLGANGPELPSLGLGCMGMSDFYGPAEEAESIATIQTALEAGVTLLDTGDFYGMGRNELLLREALKGGKRDRVFLQVKFGAQRDPAGAFIGYDARPAAVKKALITEAFLESLNGLVAQVNAHGEKGSDEAQKLAPKLQSIYKSALKLSMRKKMAS